jgi:hypothetical protein
MWIKQDYGEYIALISESSEPRRGLEPDREIALGAESGSWAAPQPKSGIV